MLIHRGFVGLINENVVFISNFFDFCLHHAVVVKKAVVGVFGLADGQLQLFLDLFLNISINTFEVMFYLRSWSLTSSSSSSSASTSSSSCSCCSSTSCSRFYSECSSL